MLIINFLFFIILLEPINCSPPVYSKMFFGILKILGIAVMGALFIIAWAGICCFKPKIKEDPSIPLTIFHMLAICVVIIASVCIFFGGDKVKKIQKQLDEYESYAKSFIGVIQQASKTSTNNFPQISNNISKITNYSISLKQMTLDYNNTFSDQKGNYRKTFNNIYFNSDDFLKSNLQTMDNSRITILSELMAYTDKYQQYSSSIQNTFQMYSPPSNNLPKRSIISLTRSIQRLTKINEKNNNYNNDDYEDDDPFDYITSFNVTAYYIYGGIVLAFAFFYIGLFFYSNKCTACCFCFYPIWAMLVGAVGWLATVLVTDNSYKKIRDICAYQRPNKHSNIIKLIFDKNRNLIDQETATILYNSINSESIHKTHELLNSKNLLNPLFESDLNELFEIIKQKEKSLEKIKQTFKNMTETSFSMQNNLNLLSDKIERSVNRTIQKAPIIETWKSCDHLASALNCFIHGGFILFISLILVLFPVCIRRKTMNSFTPKQKKQIDLSTDENI